MVKRDSGVSLDFKLTEEEKQARRSGVKAIFGNDDDVEDAGLLTKEMKTDEVAQHVT